MKPERLQKVSPSGSAGRDHGAGHKQAAPQMKTAARNVLAAADRGTGTSNNAQTYQT
jgi:hypothetical protein